MARLFIRTRPSLKRNPDEVKAVIRAAIAELDPEGPICINVKNGAGPWSGGRAYPYPPGISNAPPSALRLITLRLGDPDLDGRFPHIDRTYGPEQTSNRWPRWTARCWHEEVFHLVAHEAAHCRQWDDNRPGSEIDAERRALAALTRWQRAGRPGHPEGEC